MDEKNGKSKPKKPSANKTAPPPWFRVYHEALDDPKIQRLDPHTFKLWFNLLCIAARNDGCIENNLDNLAWSLRVSRETADEAINALVLGELLDIQPDKTLKPHNWDSRQFKSDVSTERVRRHRLKRNETFQKRDETENETPPEQSRADTEQNNIAAAAAISVSNFIQKEYGINELEANDWVADQVQLYGESKLTVGLDDYKRKQAASQLQTHSLATLRGFISSATPQGDPNIGEPEHMRVYREAMEKMKAE